MANDARTVHLYPNRKQALFLESSTRHTAYEMYPGGVASAGAQDLQRNLDGGSRGYHSVG